MRYYELAKHGTRLKPVDFGSRECDKNERNFHAFVGEAPGYCSEP